MTRYHICYRLSSILCSGVTIEARNVREAIQKSKIEENEIIYVANLEEVHSDLRQW
jgi:hypothetical protein